jgi:hypothetical protein
MIIVMKILAIIVIIFTNIISCRHFCDHSYYHQNQFYDHSSGHSYNHSCNYFHEIIGLYYKTITIVIMMIVSGATIWSIIYGRN